MGGVVLVLLVLADNLDAGREEEAVAVAVAVVVADEEEALSVIAAAVAGERRATTLDVRVELTGLAELLVLGLAGNGAGNESWWDRILLAS